MTTPNNDYKKPDLKRPLTLPEQIELTKEEMEDPRWPMEVVRACGFDPDELFDEKGEVKK